MLRVLCILWGIWFIYTIHPLWLRLVVFFVRITVSLCRFFQEFESGIFSYLFVMVYRGGLLLLLVYMSALVPNSNLRRSLIFGLLIFIGILSYSIYTAKENFNYNQYLEFSFQKFLGINYFITYKDLIYRLIWLLLLSFRLISLVICLLKYPLRSL